METIPGLTKNDEGQVVLVKDGSIFAKPTGEHKTLSLETKAEHSAEEVMRILNGKVGQMKGDMFYVGPVSCKRTLDGYKYACPVQPYEVVNR